VEFATALDIVRREPTPDALGLKVGVEPLGEFLVER